MSVVFNIFAHLKSDCRVSVIMGCCLNWFTGPGKCVKFEIWGTAVYRNYIIFLWFIRLLYKLNIDFPAWFDMAWTNTASQKCIPLKLVSDFSIAFYHTCMTRFSNYGCCISYSFDPKSLLHSNPKNNKYVQLGFLFFKSFCFTTRIVLTARTTTIEALLKLLSRSSDENTLATTLQTLELLTIESPQLVTSQVGMIYVACT